MFWVQYHRYFSLLVLTSAIDWVLSRKAPSFDWALSRKAPSFDWTLSRKAPSFDWALSRKAPSFDWALSRKAPSFDWTLSRKAPSFDWTMNRTWWTVRSRLEYLMTLLESSTVNGIVQRKAAFKIVYPRNLDLTNSLSSKDNFVNYFNFLIPKC